MLAAVLVLFFMPAAFAGLQDFNGSWKNSDAGTQGVTRLNVRINGNDVSVQAWGQCHPNDCDWGRVRATPYATDVSADIRARTRAISAFYRKDFSESLLVLRLSGSGRLSVDVFTRFTDGSGRSDYTNSYTFQRQAASLHPAPVPPPPPPPSPPTASLSEDCVGFNWQNIEARRINGRWKIVEGSHSIMDFGDNQAEARQALHILKNYRATQQCFVGRPDPSMTYILSEGNTPSGAVSGEDCILFNPDRIQVRRIDGRWKIVEGSHWIMDFGDKQNEARTAFRIIQKYDFTRTCFVGRPGPSMSYLRR